MLLGRQKAWLPSPKARALAHRAAVDSKVIPGKVMSFTSGDACHFGSPIFTIHVLPKALLTKVVELKNRVLRRPKLEEKSVEFFMVAELLAARDFETRSGPGCSSAPSVRDCLFE